MHGWAISERIQQISNDVLQVNQGSLYPAFPFTNFSKLSRADSCCCNIARSAAEVTRKIRNAAIPARSTAPEILRQNELLTLGLLISETK